MDDQDSLELKEEGNTSHSFAESDDKSQSISTPIKSEEEDEDNSNDNNDNSNDNLNNNNDNNDSEVERSDNESLEEAKEEEEEEEKENDNNNDENDNNNENDINNDENDINNDEDENSTNLNIESKSPKDDEDNNNKENNDESDNHSIKSSDDEDQDDQLRKIKEVDEIFGNSDSEDDDVITTNKKRKIQDSSSSDNNDSDSELPAKKKKTKFDDSDEDNDDDDVDQKKKKTSDDEDDDDDKDKEKKVENEILPDISSSSSEDELELDDNRSNKNRGDFVYDFDIMMAKKKEQNSKNRRRKNQSDLINDNDDFICEFLNQMKQAAEDDFELNKDKKAATRKMKLLPQVQLYLRKIDLRETFLDSGVLSVITDWLTPLPDRSLPNLQVRETLLKLLLELNIMDVDRLKSSSIGKAVMYLYKHPKETKENKRKAAQLISNWSRPIFNCETDYQSISKEDREQRDYELSQKAVQSRKSDSSLPNTSAQNDNQQQQLTTLKPGDKGWVSRTRARVPAPSTKTYVVRPKSSISDIRTVKIHVQDSKEKFLKKYLRQKKKR